MKSSWSYLMIIQKSCRSHVEVWWNSPKRMELDCRVCGKAYGRGADQPSKCVQVFSSPIIHDLFNDSSWCNEQSYLGEKGLPSPGIEPKTFRFPCRCSNHWATRLGWLNKEKLLHTTMLGLSCCFNTPRTMCNGDDPGRCNGSFGCDQCPTLLSFRRQSDPK